MKGHAKVNGRNVLGLEQPREDETQNNIKNRIKRENSMEIHSVFSQLKSSPASTSQLSNPRQRRCGETLRRLIEDSDDLPEVLRLAYVASSQEVHIDQETLYFLQKYSTFEVLFVGILGQQGCGKSFLLDIVLNLTGSFGSQFMPTEGTREKGIYLWNIPFSTSHKKRIFLLECSGITFQHPKLLRQDQILLDLFNILCSGILLLHRNQSKQKRKNPIFQQAQNVSNSHMPEALTSSSNRILNDIKPAQKQDSYWPQLLYSFYYSRIPSWQISSLYPNYYSHCALTSLPQPLLTTPAEGQLLGTLNNELSGVSTGFLQRVQQIMVEVINRCSTKQFNNLKYTGNICCKLLINSIKYFNKKPKIKINKIFQSILKELYTSSFTYHTELYDDYLQDFFQEERAMGFDELLQAFSLASSAASLSFNEIIIEEELHDEYQQKLLAYIEKKEQLIMEINSKKTKNTLKEKIKQMEKVNQADGQSIKKFAKRLNSIEESLDHNRVFIVAEKLLKYTKNMQKTIIQQQQRRQKQTIKSLQEDLKYSNEVYKQIKMKNQQSEKINKQNERQYKKIIKEQNSLDASIRTLKKQIQAEKKYQKQYIVTKQSKRQYAQNLLEIVRELQEKVRQGKRNMQEIDKQYEYHPDILHLQKKIEEKEREIRDLQKLQQRIQMQSRHSAIAKSSLLGKSSIMRSAVQKPNPKVQSKPIKRLSKKGAFSEK